MITTYVNRGISGVAVTALMLSGAALATATPAAATGFAPGVSQFSGSVSSLVTATRVEDKVYISRVYRNLLQRNPDPTGLASWISVLQRGTPRIAVANGITNSAEFRGGLITDAYNKYLGRLPDAAGMSAWQGAMTRGWTDSRVASGLITSNEYYVLAGSSDAALVRRLYRNVLGRPGSATELASWVAKLRAGTRRDQVAMAFLLSNERLASEVDGYYLHLLGRAVDPAGQRGWVAILQAGGREEAVIGGIVSSQEYILK
jgi:hypothetical protein